jgi:hypothetical protein
MESGWWWRDADTVIFSVNSGNRKDFFVPNPLVWYQYHPSTDQLEELKDDPSKEISNISAALVNLSDVQPDKDGSYRNVKISPTGDRFVYPHFNEKGSSYWYNDSKTGTKIDLGVPSQIGANNISLNIFWSATSQLFVVEGQGWSNSYVPIKIITIDGEKSSIQSLTDLSPFSTYGEGFRASNFRVMGISTDGQYILIQPETMDNISWLYNLNTAELSTINFAVRGEQVIWLNATTFVAKTDVGVVQYDIQKQIIQTLVASKVLPSEWSPDGRFLLGMIFDGSGAILNNKIAVCRIR